MLSEEVKDIARRIGRFYLNKNNGDYQAAAKEIGDLSISKIETTTDNYIAITSGRVGLLIGPRGKNIEKLQDYLQNKIKIIEQQDPLYYYLIPYPPEEEF